MKRFICFTFLFFSLSCLAGTHPSTGQDGDPTTNLQKVKITCMGGENSIVRNEGYYINPDDIVWGHEADKPFNGFVINNAVSIYRNINTDSGKYTDIREIKHHTFICSSGSISLREI